MTRDDVVIKFKYYLFIAHRPYVYTDSIYIIMDGTNSFEAALKRLDVRKSVQGSTIYDGTRTVQCHELI